MVFKERVQIQAQHLQQGQMCRIPGRIGVLEAVGVLENGERLLLDVVTHRLVAAEPECLVVLANA